MKKNYLFILLIIAMGVLSACGSSSPQTAADFYKGKTITFIVTYDPGGGYDAMARSLAPYLEKYTGATVLVKNVPGGGGILGTNTVYASKPDGLTIALLPGGAVVSSQLLNAEGIAKVEGIEYDLQKFSYLGRVSGGPQVIFTGSDNKELKTAEDLMNYSGELVSAQPGKYEDVSLNLMVVKNALNIPAELVFGYKGMAAVELAVMSGEVDMAAGTAQDRLPKVKTGDLRPLLLVGGAYSEMADVPQAVDLAEGKNKELIQALDTLLLAGRPVVAPPEVPEDKRQFLEDALKQSLEDPQLQEEWKKLSWVSSWATGSEYQEVVNTIFNEMPEDIFEIWKKELAE